MKVLIVMGSESDFPVVKKAADIIDSFGVSMEIRALSAHRTSDVAIELAKDARKNGIEVIIAAAGKAAHLPGVLAAVTPLPVIGLPIKSSTLDGLDSLLSIVQMPKGVPVATVAVDGAENAGLLAVQILSLKYPELMDAMVEYKKKMELDVLEKDRQLCEKINGMYRG